MPFAPATSDTQPAPYRRQFASKLSNRFALILALALMPIGIIAFDQTDTLEDEIRARSGAALLGATLRAAQAETGVILHAQGLVGALALALPDVVADPAKCNALMSEVVKLEPAAAVVQFVPYDGLMTCSSSGESYDYSTNQTFLQVRAQTEPSFAITSYGPVTRTSLLIIFRPVLASDGSTLGFAVMGLPHNKLRDLKLEGVDLTAIKGGLSLLWTFGRSGTVLTSNTTLDAVNAQLPLNTPLASLVGTTGRVFQGEAPGGFSLTYAVVPIVANELYLMSSSAPEPLSFLANNRLSSYLPILLMWIAGLAVSAYAAERLVTRHVRTLNRSIVSFARGDRRLQAINLKGAPVELDELASAYFAMTETITRSEAELEDTLHQKEVLLREVHHRVKNNLQLISSIMNIQIRSAHSGEARFLLKDLQDRIMSLAHVHRSLYQTSGLADVSARELIPDIVRQIMSLASGPEKPFDTQLDIADLRLVPDQAVPMSLLLAEALTNAIKHAGASRSHRGTLRVRLKRAGGSDAVLEVSNTMRTADPREPSQPFASTGLGSQLILAFVQQLGGTLDATRTEGEYLLRVTFEVAPLSQAENRHAPDSPDLVEGNDVAT